MIVLILWRRSKGRNQSPQTIETLDKPELSGEGKDQTEVGGEGAEPRESGGDALLEAAGASKPAEMGANERAELESEWRGWEAPVKEAGSRSNR